MHTCMHVMYSFCRSTNNCIHGELLDGYSSACYIFLSQSLMAVYTGGYWTYFCMHVMSVLNMSI